MNRSQLMRLDNMSIDIYDIHGYFRELTVDQLTPGFWDITIILIRNSLYILINKPYVNSKVYIKYISLINTCAYKKYEKHYD